MVVNHVNFDGQSHGRSARSVIVNQCKVWREKQSGKDFSRTPGIVRFDLVSRQGFGKSTHP